MHRFADESSSPVISVDCWCLLDGDAALVECQAKIQTSSEPGLYARVDADPPCWTKLHAIIAEPLTRAAVEATMERFAKLGFPDGLPSELRPGGPLVRLKA